MTEALIKPEILRWARERSQLSTSGLAAKIPVKEERLLSWETGDAHPTFHQAQTLADKLHVPFGYLFLSSPPREKLGLPDLRTIRNVEHETISLEFSDLLSDTLTKQQWYQEYQREVGETELPFVASFSIEDSPEDVAEDIADTLQLNSVARENSSSWEDFLRKFMFATEESGILVLRNGVVGNNTSRPLSVQEFRGFAISDALAPLVFLNGKDSKAAQIFTLAHELAHIWVGESGISDPDLGRVGAGDAKEIENFCNKVAAELLVPSKQFVDSWDRNVDIGDNVNSLVRRYRVSSIVILRRALELNRISRFEFQEQYERELEEIKKHKSRQTGSGGDFYSTLKVRLGSRFLNAVISATFEGRLLFRDAARLANVKRVKTLYYIADNLGVRKRENA